MTSAIPFWHFRGHVSIRDVGLGGAMGDHISRSDGPKACYWCGFSDHKKSQKDTKVSRIRWPKAHFPIYYVKWHKSSLSAKSQKVGSVAKKVAIWPIPSFTNDQGNRSVLSRKIKGSWTLLWVIAHFPTFSY